MSRSTPITIGLEQLVREARLERSAAIGRAILDGASAIGALFTSAFTSQASRSSERPSAKSARARNKLSSLSGER
jgi:hypothetical protein